MLLLLLLPWPIVTSRALEIGDQEVFRAMVQQMKEDMRKEMREEMRAEIKAVEDKFNHEAAAIKSKQEMDASKIEIIEMSKVEFLELETGATSTSMSSLEACLPSTISQVVRDLPVLTTRPYRGHWPSP